MAALLARLPDLYANAGADKITAGYYSFWTVAGSVGFGGFYALICFSADHSPGWVIATTWQSTIIASLFVLMGFGRRFLQNRQEIFKPCRGHC